MKLSVLAVSVLLLLVAFSGFQFVSAQRLSTGKSPEIQRAIRQVDALHSELAPMPWTEDLPTHIGWWRCRNLQVGLHRAVLEVEEFPENSGILVLNLCGPRVPLTELEDWEWSDAILYWPED